MKMENFKPNGSVLRFQSMGLRLPVYMIKRKRRNFCGREIPRIGKDIPRSFSRT